MGRSTGKDDQTTVNYLIKSREAEVNLRGSEATLRRELAEERKRFEDFRRYETVRTMRIVADKDLEIIQQVEKLREVTHPDSNPNLPPGLL